MTKLIPLEHLFLFLVSSEFVSIDVWFLLVLHQIDKIPSLYRVQQSWRTKFSIYLVPLSATHAPKLTTGEKHKWHECTSKGHKKFLLIPERKKINHHKDLLNEFSNQLLKNQILLVLRRGNKRLRGLNQMNQAVVHVWVSRECS